MYVGYKMWSLVIWILYPLNWLCCQWQHFYGGMFQYFALVSCEQCVVGQCCCSHTGLKVDRNVPCLYIYMYVFHQSVMILHVQI